MSIELQALRQAFDDQAALLERWVDQVVGRTWLLGKDSDKISQLRERCGAIVEALAEALKSDEVALGSPQWREPIHLLSFTAGWMAGVGIPISGALALAHGLRDAVGGGTVALFDDLTTAAAEAYAAGIQQQAEAHHRNVIERSQVVCLLGDSLPCLFLVGDPDRQALDDAVGRLMMVAVMREAQTMIVDASGLVAPETTLVAALRILADHRSEPPPRLVLTSVAPALVARLSAGERPAGMKSHERLEAALKEANAATEGR